MKKGILTKLIVVLPLPILLLSLLVGASESISLAKIFSYEFWTNTSGSNLAHTILFHVRLPRILLVFITGAVLAVSGSAMQAVFRNPLVDPYILGLSSGAAFGAALAVSVLFIPVQLSAFIFGLAAVGLSYMMARKNRQISVVGLILAGVITNGIFTSLLTVVQIISNPLQLQSIVHWIMGSFHSANWDELNMVLFPVVAGGIVLYLFRWKLNVLALGDEESMSAGLNPGRIKIWILLSATLASSAVIAVSGIIGLYGLIVPHIVRMLMGVNNKTTMMINILLGGSFLVIIDNFSRSFKGFEIPVGVFTMLICAPFFIWLLKKSKIGWQQ
ncbi:FecCD family ABC transporter permease [Marinilabilia rubra]|uniref:Iron transporter n=1 Tax=Marinilabilia rubra TaxID=2162893 RepID=A0A2U2B7M6_9BACT|nr:iron ABC transporter permease [Marinilabilia rubra]PWD99055.1 iron transporter [Marinilabilia rubra]